MEFVHKWLEDSEILSYAPTVAIDIACEDRWGKYKSKNEMSF